jgi:hypothetical protein
MGIPRPGGDFVAPGKNVDNLFLYFKLDRLSTPIIEILAATNYLPVWR